MTKIFFTPVRFNGPRYHPMDAPSVKRIRSLCAPIPIGINVWMMNDNTFTQRQPILNEGQIKRVFKGGSKNIVSEEEAELLIAAGYTVIDDGVVAPPPDPDPTPGPDPDPEPTPGNGTYTADYTATY